MTTLIAMRPAHYAGWLAAAVADYARQNIAAGRWPAAGAEARSRADYASLLPQGMATPDHHLFEILASADGAVVGVLWFAIDRRHGVVAGFVYDVEIHAEHRRQGHARRAFEALEPIAMALGATTLGLHVFGHNTGAQALYRSLGFGVTGLNLQKPLGRDRG